MIKLKFKKWTYEFANLVKMFYTILKMKLIFGIGADFTHTDLIWDPAVVKYWVMNFPKGTTFSMKISVEKASLVNRGICNMTSFSYDLTFSFSVRLYCHVHSEFWISQSRSFRRNLSSAQWTVLVYSSFISLMWVPQKITFKKKAKKIHVCLYYLTTVV